MATARQSVLLTRIKNGDPGQNGITYQPIRIRDWSKILAGSPIYDGTGDAPYTDVVFETTSAGRVYYRCVKRCTKRPPKPTTPSSPSESVYSTYLQQTSQFEMIATGLLLAVNAAIGLVNTNAIQLNGADGTLHGEITGFRGAGELMAWFGPSSSEKTWGVYGNGSQFVGDPNGQHIAFNPEARTMEVYDASRNCVAIHSGRTITLVDARPSGATSTLTSTGASFTALSSSGSSTKSVSGTAGAAGSLQVTVPAMRLTATLNNAATSSGSASEDVDEKETPTTTGTLRLTVVTKVTTNGTTVETVRASRRIAQAAAGFGPPEEAGSSETSSTVTVEETKLSVTLAANEVWEARLTLDAMVEGGTGSGGSVACVTTASGANLTAGLVEKVYRCEYGANGWVISYDSQNFEYHLVINGVLHCLCVAGGTKVFGNDSYP